MPRMDLQLLLLLPILTVLCAKVQAEPVTSSGNTEMLNAILQIVQTQAGQIKDLREKIVVEKTGLEDFKTKENFLLSVLTGQQGQLATKMDQMEEMMTKNQEQLQKNQEQVNKNQESISTNVELINQNIEQLRQNQEENQKNIFTKFEETNKLACDIHHVGLTLTTLIGRKYYFSFNQPRMSWFDADNFCKRHHMDLVSVETKEEWLALKPEVEKLINKVGVWPWSSARDSVQEGNWKWGTGSVVTVHSHSRLGHRDDEDCMYLSTDYWDDTNCSFKLLFICEVNSVC